MSRVLLIEDDILLGRHFERSLLSAGFEVRTCEHLVGVMDVVDSFGPDVIVTDILLTGSTALPLMNELMSHDDLSKIPVIAITSLADDITLDALRPYGVRAILDKTAIHPDDLLASVRKVLP